MEMANDPFLAIGMVSAPQNFERRRSVRRDMLDLPSVRAGAIVFRFLLGRVSPKARFVFGSFEEFQAECTHNRDVLLLNSLDGPGPNKQCSCAEKTVAWMRHAQQLWPKAVYYGKTEGESQPHACSSTVHNHNAMRAAPCVPRR